MSHADAFAVATRAPRAAGSRCASATGRTRAAATLARARLTAAALLGVASLATAAQTLSPVHRIGYLSMSSAAATYTRPIDAFRDGMRELGWVEGRNVRIEYRFAEGQADRLPALADELARLKVDLIVASPTPAAVAAKNATRTIPIVATGLTHPVAAGLVASLAHPGGNVTGLTYGADTDIAGKQLQLLRELVPRARRFAVLHNPAGGPNHALILDSITSAARTLQLPLQVVNARTPQDIDAAFAAMARDGIDALLLTGDPMFFVHRARLAELTLQHRLPTMSTQSQWPDAGGLASYGPSLPDQFRRAATYVDKILKGARPGELPIEEPTKFELVINLRTAKALGVDVPQPMLQRADELLR